MTMNLQAMFSAVMRALDKSVEMSSTMSSKNVGLIFVAFICTILPLDVSQLAFAIIGALAYALLQAFSPRPAKTKCQLVAEQDEAEQRVHLRTPLRTRNEKKEPYHSNKGNPSTSKRPSWFGSDRSPHTRPETWSQRHELRGKHFVPPVVKPEVYKPSSMPVCAPTFTSSGWDAEVSELLQQLTPGASEAQSVRRLALHVQQMIKGMYPDVEVSGFAHAGLACGKAFAIAVPEVDIVANISPTALAARLYQQRQQVDVKKFQKSAVRLCTDRLVANGGFKFRRSAFRGDEPRVTLLVPPHLGFFNDSVPVDFSINTVTPFYTAALFTECGQIDLRAKALILLVKRWAKDRGICHAAKGHLSPYLWSLLAMYFLQVGVDEEGPLLPALEHFKISSSLAASSPNKQKGSSPTPAPKKADAENAEKLSVGQLFGKFVNFYSQCYNWRGEAISIRLGRRAAPGLSVPLHVLLNEDGTSAVGPAIEDPFKAGNNLGTCMNTVSLARLHEELSRADGLYQRGGSLAELLQPWVPVEDVPERSSPSSGSGEQDEDQTLAASKKSSA